MWLELWVGLARKLLKAFRAPPDAWAHLLAPTRGQLPKTDPEYEAFTDYLKCHLALYLSPSNIIHVALTGTNHAHYTLHDSYSVSLNSLRQA